VTVAKTVEMSIAELSAEFGISPRTIRYYEELTLLPSVGRRSNGRRVYGADEVERLRFIQRLKALGLSLAEIGKLNAVYCIAGSTEQMLEHLAALLEERLQEVEGRIAELKALRVNIRGYRDRIAERLKERT